MVFLKSELARKCGVSDSTLHGRIEEFKEFFTPIKKDNKVYFSKKSLIKVIIIQGMRSAPNRTFSKHEIEDVLSEVNYNFDLLVDCLNKTLDEIENLRK
ncbi:hypothetical protein [Priestia megaterium]|uniref:hypothetical protein n=1 Tax=Priestia megaterium TaxID=1404 RepID=UPI001A946366|nr:hypothetical protein [Priestia megaterium]QSX18465.1 hypothetical protein J0P05_14370 [Priestia megaterium]